MITREADYGVRVVLHLAKAANREKLVSTAELAEQMEVPYRFLRKIVRRMVEAGFVISQRGQGGGLRLARPSATISLADVLYAIDPAGVKLNLCLLHGDRCTRTGNCPVHTQMKRLQTLLDGKLAEITFDSL